MKNVTIKIGFRMINVTNIQEEIDMLQRNLYQSLLQWKKTDKNKKALLVTGARQTGKTFLIRHFGRENYENFVEINFITEPKAMAIFSDNLNADTIIASLTAYVRRPLKPGKTLIFFDEIQECPAARTAMKFLVDDGRFDYIESGSLLGVKYKEVQSYPVGYEQTLRMVPLDFTEFAIAAGIQPQTISVLRECYERNTPVNESIHQSMTDLFKYYVIVGGMPAVVQKFVDTHDIGEVLKIQNDILTLYRQDITKYSRNDKVRIKNIFDCIPSQLNDQSRRFMLSDIDKNARMNRYESSFVWLSDAGVALPCYNIVEPKIPLQINKKSNLFKLFLGDTGLLCAACMENVQFDILQGDLSVNLGSILENMFAQQLDGNGFTLYYMNKKKTGEIDFIVQRGKNVIPIEIKSGNDYEKHAALNNILLKEEWNIQKAYVFCKGNIKVVDKITYLPWYMIMFFMQEKLPDHLIVNLNIKNL